MMFIFLGRQHNRLENLSGKRFVSPFKGRGGGQRRLDGWPGCNILNQE